MKCTVIFVLVSMCNGLDQSCTFDEMDESSALQQRIDKTTISIHEMPSGGVLVLDGGKGLFEETCVTEPDTKVLDGTKIVTQCCNPTSGECHRSAVNQDTLLVDCVGNVNGNISLDIVERTFAQAVEHCQTYGLELCEQNCAGGGCRYNKYPVWSKKPCVTTTSSTTPTTTPTTTTTGAPPQWTLVQSDLKCLSVAVAAPTIAACQKFAERKMFRYFMYNADKGKCAVVHYCEKKAALGWHLYRNSAFPPEQLLEPPTEPVRHDYTVPFEQVCDKYSNSLSVKEQFLRTHNYVRCLHGHQPLIWDDQVEVNAIKAAKAIAPLGKLKHTGSFDNQPPSSENLNSGSSPQLATTAWYDEVLLPIAEKVWETGHETLDKTGHYTALIWKKTQSIGCARDTVDGYAVNVCHYANEYSNYVDKQHFEWNIPGILNGNNWTRKQSFCCADAFSFPLCDSECASRAFQVP